MKKNLVIKHIGNNTCKYHRVPGNSYDINHLGPKGLCLDLYHSAYPYFLSLSEGAEFSWMKKIDKDAVYGQCPAYDGSVHFEVRRIPLEKEVLSNGIKKLKDIILTISKIEDRQENNCVCPHMVGQKFEFNQGDFLEQICPAAFNNMFPTINTIISGGKSSWEKQNGIYIMCPDNLTKIEFLIKYE